MHITVEFLDKVEELRKLADQVDNILITMQGILLKNRDKTRSPEEIIRLASAHNDLMDSMRLERRDIGIFGSNEVGLKRLAIAVLQQAAAIHCADRAPLDVIREMVKDPKPMSTEGSYLIHINEVLNELGGSLPPGRPQAKITSAELSATA